LTRPFFVAKETTFNMQAIKYKLPLLVIVAPYKSYSEKRIWVSGTPMHISRDTAHFTSLW